MSRPIEKGQVSLEFVMLVGFAIIVSIIAFPFIAKQNELNKAVAAARDGAVFGASARGVGFGGEGVTTIPQGTIKIDELRLSYQSKLGNLDWYKIEIRVKTPDYIKNNTQYSSSVDGTVTNQSLRYVYYAFNGEWPSGIVSRVNTTSYSFTANATFL